MSSRFIRRPCRCSKKSAYGYPTKKCSRSWKAPVPGLISRNRSPVIRPTWSQRPSTNFPTASLGTPEIPKTPSAWMALRPISQCPIPRSTSSPSMASADQVCQKTAKTSVGFAMPCPIWRWHQPGSTHLTCLVGCWRRGIPEQCFAARAKQCSV